jgi:hypothetical protein
LRAFGATLTELGNARGSKPNTKCRKEGGGITEAGIHRHFCKSPNSQDNTPRGYACGLKSVIRTRRARRTLDLRHDVWEENTGLRSA